MLEIINFWALPLLQILIALGLINVWVFRFARATEYRGAGAKNMKEEFAVYGLPSWFLYVVGFFKLVIALVMILSLVITNFNLVITVYALMLLSVLMLGAIGMHLKVKDPMMKMLPALLMLAMALTSLYLIGVFGIYIG
jgi:hypothetical protein